MAKKGVLSMVGPWDAVLKFLRKLPDKTSRGLDMALRQEALLWLRTMKLIVARQGPDSLWYPNQRITVFLKGSSKPMTHHGDLFNSIAVKKIAHSFYFSGIDRKARNKKGKFIADIAAINELGIKNPQRGGVTFKQLGFLRWLKRLGYMKRLPRPGWKIKPGPIHKRPILEPTYKRLAPKLGIRIRKRVLQSMGLKQKIKRRRPIGARTKKT